MRLETQNKQGVAMLDANVHESGRIEYHTPAPGSYLSENDLLGIPILNPFFTHTVTIPSSTLNIHNFCYRHIWFYRLVPVDSPLKSTPESEKNFFLGSIFEPQEKFSQKASAELASRGETPFLS